MTARSSYIALQNIIKDLNQTTLPRLPPAMGFHGDVEYMTQVDIWKKWIEWEKSDPLVIKDEDIAAYRSRVVYVYKQALMALRFWPPTWFEAAEFCFQNEMESEGNDFLIQGIAANPESCLLAFKRADRIELTTTSEEGEASLKRRGDAVREPYDKLLNALYELIDQVKRRESRGIARLKEAFAAQQAESAAGAKEDDEDEDASPEDGQKDEKEAAFKAQIEAIEKGSSAQIRLLSRTISFAWIALMRAMRRVQGQGKVGDVIGGSRQIFSDARKRGRITSDVYVASALIEYHCYKDPAGTKIFERGVRLFPTDELFALEYLKHLIAINDITSKLSANHSFSPTR
jgi:cleavage stimulation factor subunit 3